MTEKKEGYGTGFLICFVITNIALWGGSYLLFEMPHAWWKVPVGITTVVMFLLGVVGMVGMTSLLIEERRIMKERK